MRHPFVVALGIILTLASGCGPTENEFRDSFRWISGKWKTTEGDIVKVENWKWSKHRFEGEGFHLQGSDTVFREYLFLEDYNGRIGFSAVFEGQGPFTFALIRNEEKEFVFENADHDFPSQIVYSIDSDSSLTVTLIGNGEPTVEEQSYQLVRFK